ncbi:MAG: twin-arginine translocase subunit TatC [Saprospiraceae bacterium]
MAKLGIITADDMRKYRRHSIVGILLVAAILTPPMSSPSFSLVFRCISSTKSAFL